MTTTDSAPQGPLTTTSECVRSGRVAPVLPPASPDAGSLAGTPASPLVDLWDAAELTPDHRVRVMYSATGFYNRAASDDRPLSFEPCAATGTGTAVWAVQIISAAGSTSSAWCDGCLPAEYRELVAP